MAHSHTLNLLFVCSRNQWRSPTAEKIFGGRAGFSTRSAGTSSSARKRVSAADIDWADVVFVMEKRHKECLLRDFSNELRPKQLHVLDIPDQYEFMDPELVDELRAAVDPILGRLR